MQMNMIGVYAHFYIFPLRIVFPYLLEFYLEVISYPFYKYFPSVAGYPHNVVLGSIYYMC